MRGGFVKPRAIATVLLALLVTAAGLSALQRKKEREDPNVRSVQGAVLSPEGKTVAQAIVQLKNTKTLQVRSFITRDDGTYYFHGLSTNVDYELKAEHNDDSSDVKTLSVFDSRKKAVINLKLEAKK
jgi:hypothetical protein